LLNQTINSPPFINPKAYKNVHNRLLLDNISRSENRSQWQTLVNAVMKLQVL
jgi:hypothetical protein